MNVDPLFERPVIDRFTGEYGFLSNFHLCQVEYEGIIYPSAEHAYQAAKCADDNDRWKFLALTPGQAKRYGKKIQIRPDWNKVRVDVMHSIVYLKFEQNEQLFKKLLATGNTCLEEGNTWGDKFWGTVDGVGENILGRILMHVRTTIGIKANVANRQNF